MRIRITALLLLCYFMIPQKGVTQTDSTDISRQIQEYSQYSKQLVSYLESTLNFIGDKDELQSEKDLIINNTYLKIFANDKVQVEDDLDENREIPLNKDIQAYLKDIDFFYNDVQFTFEVEDVQQLVSDSGEIVYKITLNRMLEGVTINNDSIKNNQLRYIEINLDPYHKDLKIASIYTTKVKEKDALRNWWNKMDDDWKNYFGKSIIVYDTLPLNNIVSFTDSSIVTKIWDQQTFNDTISYTDITYDSLIVSDNVPIIRTDTIDKLVYDTVVANTSTIVRILKSFKSITTIDISNNLTLNNLKPIAELTEVVKLNLSNTLISDLTPVRNLNKLEELICSGSAVSNLNQLIYNVSLVSIDISNTAVADADIISNFRFIEKLNISHTAITDISPLSKLQQLSQLKMEGTLVADFTTLSGMSNISDLDLSNSDLWDISTLDTITSLQILNIDSTHVSNIATLSKLPNLRILQANNTQLFNLEPLYNSEHLNVIYCDNSKVTIKEANSFMEKNKDCLVIFNSAVLINWWNSLSAKWKEIFRENYHIQDPINKEKLHQLINQKTISFANNNQVQSLSPLSMMHRLEDINMSETSVFDLSPLSSLNNLENINLKKTNVKNLSDLAGLNNLRKLNIESTDVDNLVSLQDISGLEIIYADNTGVDANRVSALRNSVPECLVIFQSEKLRLWWENMDSNWKNEFMKSFELPSSPTNEQLQELVNRKKLEIINNPGIGDLNALHIFKNLETLIINSTSVSDLSQLNSITTLTSLDISNNPVSNIQYLAGLTRLENLIMENTPVENIEPISSLVSLISLNISGTKVRSLKYIQSLVHLQKLYFNNTRIKNIKYIYQLTDLTAFQCYNTSVKSSKIKNFSSEFPQVEITYY